MILLPMVASADAVEIDGIYYNLINKVSVAEVTNNPNGYEGSIVIPEIVNYNNTTYSVTSIGSKAFENCKKLTSVIIPNSVTDIGSGAFEHCSGMTSITIGNGVTTIGSDAFRFCSGLTSVTIPNSVTDIGSYAFCYCSGMTSVTIGNGVMSIEERVFSNCSNLTSVTIGNSVNSIGELAFAYCSSLTSITIPNSVTSIGDNAFSNCSGMTSVTIGYGVTSIGSSAFYNCSSLTSVTIPNSVTDIGIHAFYCCSGLTSATIGNGITKINNYIFMLCSSLSSVTIPNSVTSIGIDSFYGCTSLTSITIPNSVKSIDIKAFANCPSLTSVTIGNGIKNIGAGAFDTCPNLADVTCYADNVPGTNSEAFSHSYIEYTTLHVPSVSINAYKNVEPWKNFKSIVAIDDGETPEPPATPKCAKPTISYANGQLKLSCETEGVEFVTDITNSDVKKHYDATISLTATYNISVFSTKSGYDDSDVATAILCWIEAAPQTEGLTDGVAQIAARPVLVKTDNGFITVEGVDDRTNVSIYTTDGKQVGSTVSQNNMATIATSIQPGSIAIVKIGERSVKVIIK